MVLLVVAKAPVPGRVKTRLCPPFTPVEAAAVAEASLADSLSAVACCGATRRVLALEGPRGPWLPAGFEVISQRGANLAERIANAWDDVGGPGLQIGMDTPQVTAELLDASLALLTAPRTDAVLGRAADGGWWAIGLRQADCRVFAGIATSRRDTGDRQLARIRSLGMRAALLQELTDIDDAASARVVAGLLPAGSAARAALYAVFGEAA